MAVIASLVVAAANVVIPAQSAASPVPGCGDRQVAGLNMTFYPWTDNGYPGLDEAGLVADQGLLDAFAREYANNPHPTDRGGISDSDPQVQSFFVWWLLNRLANIASGTATAPAGHTLDLSQPGDVGRMQWLAHVSGYFASVWLRTNMRTFDRALFPIVADDTVYAALYSNALNQGRDIALHGTDAEAIDFSRDTLRSNAPLTARTPGPLGTLVKLSPSDVGMFGYDAAWLRYLLPPSANAPTAARPFTDSFFEFNSTKLLDAHFALPNQPFLSRSQQDYDTAKAQGGAVADRIDQLITGAEGEESLLTYQQRYVAAGTLLYENGVPGGFGTVYRNWDQPQYDRLLTWAAYAVMYNKSNALNAMTAVATGDGALARRQIHGSMVWWVYTLTYIAAIFDPRSDTKTMSESLPTFRTSDGGSCQ
jgi:hypothetical protein